MSNMDTNIYAMCRKRTCMTQEQWAEAIGVSPESVKRYESGLRVPPNVVVAQMVDVSGEKALALRHIANTSGSLGILPEIADANLQGATIKMINCVLRFVDAHRDRQLLQIAEDGIISQEERPIYDQILAEIQELIAAALEIRYCEEGREMG